MSLEHVKVMSEYNLWMNRRLYEVCAELSDEERKLDRQAFFGSIHGTLNHLLLGDKVWLGRFVGSLFKASRLDTELFEDFSELQEEREAMDKKIIDWVSELTNEKLEAQFQFKSIVNPALRSCSLIVAVTGLFNHQTHHRGQITTLLSQCGKDIGVTDLIGLPGLVVTHD